MTQDLSTTGAAEAQAPGPGDLALRALEGQHAAESSRSCQLSAASGRVIIYSTILAWQRTFEAGQKRSVS